MHMFILKLHQEMWLFCLQSYYNQKLFALFISSLYLGYFFMSKKYSETLCK